MTAPYHKMPYDKTVILDRNPDLTSMLPSCGNAFRKDDDAGSTPTAGTTRMQVNTGLEERDGMNKTYQADGVECDWQTVFWRIPTSPHRSDNLGVPSSTKAAISSRTSAGAAKSSSSGLEFHLAEDEAVTLGEQVAGEMIWGKGEDLRSSNLYLVSLVLFIKLMLGDQGEAEGSD